MVVFDRIARPHDARALQAGNRCDQSELHVLRQRGRDPVRIDGGVVEAFRLEKDLMPVALAEAHDLVLDRGAIARPAALDLAGIHRRAVDVGADDLVGRRRRAGDAALDLRIGDARGEHRERLRRFVAGLQLRGAPVDGRAVEPGRGAGLEAAQREAGAGQRAGKAERGRLADPAGRDLPLTDMDEAAQERAGGQHHSGGAEASGRPGAARR